MDAESTICLSDLVPALRWTRAQQVAEVLADPRLPAGWWGSVALGRALGATGVDWLCERLARLAATRWDHLALTDLLPAIQVHSVDPTLPGWQEPARSAVTALGGWHRLRRLTPGDLQNPSSPATPEAVLAIVFREIFTHLQLPVTAADPAASAAPSAPAQDTAVEQAAPSTTGQGQAGQQAAAEQATQTRPSPAVSGPLPAPTPAAQAPGGPQLPTRQPGQGARSGPPAPAPAPAAGAPARPAAAAPAAPVPSEYPMVGLVEQLFRDWDPLSKAVAAERLFAAEPVSLRALAHRLNVDREILSQAQRAVEERVLMWLRSPDSAALTGHLFGLTEWLGTAATQDQLIAADPSHPVEVPALGTPLWRVLVTLMPDRRLQEGWLVVGDLGGLRDKTHQLLATKPADTDMVELLGQLGIRPHSAKAWLDALPKEQPRPEQRPAAAAPGETKPLPRRTPGANGHQQRNGVPVPSQAGNGPDPATALAALNALTGAAPRPHLVPSPRTTPTSPSSDPRRWQRIDVTSGHLRGEPVAVPEGYAAQLGMRPGTLLSVTGPGDNAVVLVWRDQQPVFDSLQPVLMRLNARPGDSVYVTVDGYRLDAQLTS
ncbi:hypothetical protein [Microtetraspora fusca]|uniref:hypothetical protein n=1 Tax=Microtetraspora fusca TaxID=1997 RepID=UPI00082BDEA9|nr:hypothetical protein [Microtetraspora fusca]